MKISVQLFSMFRYFAGVDKLDLELASGAKIDDLLDDLVQRFDNPVFANDNPLLLLMVNNKNATRQTVLAEGDVVLLLPVLGGG